MVEELYIDYSIRLLEAAKKVYKKKRREHLFEAKIPLTMGEFFNKFAKTVVRFFKRKNVKNLFFVTSALKKLKKNLYKAKLLSQNANNVENAKRALIAFLEESKKRILTEACEDKSCEDIISKIEYVKEKISKPHAMLVESYYGRVVVIKTTSAVSTGYYITIAFLFIFIVLFILLLIESASKRTNTYIRGKDIEEDAERVFGKDLGKFFVDAVRFFFSLSMLISVVLSIYMFFYILFS